MLSVLGKETKTVSKISVFAPGRFLCGHAHEIELTFVYFNPSQSTTVQN